MRPLPYGCCRVSGILPRGRNDLAQIGRGWVRTCRFVLPAGPRSWAELAKSSLPRHRFPAPDLSLSTQVPPFRRLPFSAREPADFHLRPNFLVRAGPRSIALVGSLLPTRNDLELPARALAPSIGSALDALAAVPGCLLARMSGSGATCFGLFASAEAAEAAAAALARPGWWTWGGGLNNQPPP